MNIISSLTVIQWAAALLCGIFTIGVALAIRRTLRLHALDKEGDYVAEAWLEWSICTGSTMYRGRFASEARAHAEVKSRAMWLDFLLPKYYRAENAAGRMYWESYDFSIRYGVRKLTEYEKAHGVQCFWTDKLPGHSSHRGEHRDAHPGLQPLVFQEPGNFAGSLERFKV